jgi:hypothetical protein
MASEVDDQDEWMVNLSKYCLKRIAGFKNYGWLQELVHQYVLQVVYTKYMKKL